MHDNHSCGGRFEQIELDLPTPLSEATPQSFQRSEPEALKSDLWQLSVKRMSPELDLIGLY